MDAVISQFVAKSADWKWDLQHLFERIGSRFGRRETQQGAQDYVTGLLSPIERKNSWQLAEAVEQPAPYSIQYLLDRARWDANEVRDDLRAYVVEHLGQNDAVLVVDETGFLKKGRHSVRVQHQYSGTAGRFENCQIGVFLAYASTQGRALIDRELYLPREWADDMARRHAAKVPKDVAFATKPQLAQQMIERACVAQVPFAWIIGDEVYGDNRSLRVWLEQQELHFVLAVASNQFVGVGINGQKKVAQLVARVAEQDWATLSAGDGAKGPRDYDWVRIPLLSWQIPGERWLLLRRSLLDAKLAITCVMSRAARIWRPWCGWPVCGGRWKNASKRPREKSGWTSMKCAAGMAGTGISRWR